MSSHLTNREKDVCSYTGLFGVLLSTTCLIQNFVFFNPHWITTTLIIVYLLAITSFSLLAAQHHLAPLMLIITGSLLLVCAVLLIFVVFSLVVILLFVYVTVITVMLYIDRFPIKLKQKALAARAEKDAWRGKI